MVVILAFAWHRRDGAKVLLTPENSIQCQKAYGSDIIIPLDELRMFTFHAHCLGKDPHQGVQTNPSFPTYAPPAAPYHMDAGALRRSLDRTHRWELRSLREHLVTPNNQAMYCVRNRGGMRWLAGREWALSRFSTNRLFT